MTEIPEIYLDLLLEIGDTIGIMRGTVTRVRQDDVAAAHIDQLAYKYMGLDRNPYAKAGDVRVMFEISVFSVQGMS